MGVVIMCEAKLEKTDFEKLFKEFDAQMDSYDDTCELCHYLKQWQESRGEFWGAPCSESMAECEVGEKFMECLRFRMWLKEQKKLCPDCGGIIINGHCGCCDEELKEGR
jgi:hypothetical protein